jgi:hypothetical protein
MTSIGNGLRLPLLGLGWRAYGGGDYWGAQSVGQLIVAVACNEESLRFGGFTGIFTPTYADIYPD